MEVLVALMEKLQLQGVTLGLQGCLGAACVRALLRVPQVSACWGPLNLLLRSLNHFGGLSTLFWGPSIFFGSRQPPFGSPQLSCNRLPADSCLPYLAPCLEGTSIYLDIPMPVGSGGWVHQRCVSPAWQPNLGCMQAKRIAD
jgi:hypothetical protein